MYLKSQLLRFYLASPESAQIPLKIRSEDEDPIEDPIGDPISSKFNFTATGNEDREAEKDKVPEKKLELLIFGSEKKKKKS